MAEVTAAEIARLAGVGRAAVGNWRKRYADFPQPVGGSTGSPTFRLGDVESWLEANDRKPSDDPRQRVRRILLGTTDPQAVVRLAEQVVRPPRSKAARVLDGVVRDIGPSATLDLLLGAYVELAAPAAETPAVVSHIMVSLAGVRGLRVHDPACGTGGLLAAALDGGAAEVAGLESDPTNAAMATLRLALKRPDPSDIRIGDLRNDPFASDEDRPSADVVLCHPPFAVRDWGHGELAYDERWEFGVPPKQESELAWVQHGLARVRPAGPVVMLLPPAVASRPSGRRIRAELLRRGAVWAIISLPPGTASPPHLSLHLWLLNRPPPPGVISPQAVRLIDASGVDQDELAAVLEAATQGRRDDLVARASVVDLLDDEVDLTPARHVKSLCDTADVPEILAQRDRLLADLGSLPARIPVVGPSEDAGPLPMTTVADLIRVGAITLHSQPNTTVEPGDVLIAVQASDISARVATDRGELGASRVLLRPQPDHIDSWFLAGFVARQSNLRLVSSLGSTQRLDLRRASVPRIPLERQRQYAGTFADLQTLRDSLVSAAENGQTVANLIAEGLAAGSLIGQT